MTTGGGGNRWFTVTAWTYYVLAGLSYLEKYAVALGVVSAAGGAVVWLLALYGEYSKIIGTALGLVGVTGLLVGFGWLLARIRQRSGLLNPTLDILSSVDTYEVLPSNHYRFALHLKVRARVDGVDKYRLKFRWTGTGAEQFSVSDAHRLVEEDGQGVWNTVAVKFPNHLEKGGSTEFELEMRFHDSSKKAHPYLRKLVDDIYPNGLTMRVILCEQLRARRCFATIFPSSRGDIVIGSPKRVECDPKTGELKWYIRRPRLGYRYSIDWGT